MGTELGAINYEANGESRQIRRDNEVWTFDGVGRMVGAPGGRKIHWASNERVACFAGGQAPSYRLEYLPDGSRFTEVRRDANGQRSRLYFNRYAQLDKEKNQWTKFFYVDRDPNVLIIGNESQIIMRDALGTAELESNKDGANYSVHHPFGGLARESKKVDWAGNYRYAGSMGTSNFEFYQMKNRFYDPRIGQFISPDPMFMADPKNCVSSPLECELYSYGRNNPLSYTDPNGHFVVNGVAAGVGAAVGGAVAGVMEYSTGPADNKGMRVFAAVVGGAIGGATVGGTLGVAAAGGFAGDAVKQGILMAAGIQKDGYSAKSAIIATGSGVLGGIVGKGLTGGFSEKAMASGGSFAAAAESKAASALWKSEMAKEYATGLVQIAHEAERMGADATFDKALSKTFEAAAAKEFAAGAAVGAGVDGYAGSMIENKVNGAIND